jgi:hypothetical protein
MLDSVSGMTKRHFILSRFAVIARNVLYDEAISMTASKQAMQSRLSLPMRLPRSLRSLAMTSFSASLFHPVILNSFQDLVFKD